MIHIFQSETNVSLMWHLIETGHENLWLYMGYPRTQIFVIKGGGVGWAGEELQQSSR